MSLEDEMGKNRIKLDGNSEGSFGKGPLSGKIQLGGGLEIKKTERLFSGEEKTNMIISGLNSLVLIVDGFTSWQKEKEQTKRILSDNSIKMNDSKNDLKKALAEAKTRNLQIQKEFELNYKKLENEAELNRWKAEIIKEMLITIRELRSRSSEYENQYGVSDEKSIQLSNQLHELSMNLTNQLQLQG